VRRALDAGVVAILGADWTRVAVDVYSEIQRAGGAVPLITGGSTAASLGNSAEYPGLLRSVISDTDGTHTLLQDLVARAAATPPTNGTSPEHIVVLYSKEPYGEGAVEVVESSSALGGPMVLAKACFDSRASAAEVRVKVQELLDAVSSSSSQSLLRGRRPMFFIAATGPDTTTSMLALAAEHIAGPTGGDWVVGATEAPESVIHSAEEAADAMGYNSFEPDFPVLGSCAATDIFYNRFRGRFGRPPTGGFVASSYDSVVLLSRLVRIAQNLSEQPPDVSPMQAAVQRMRSSGIGVQGFTGPLVFVNGQNQPCRPAVLVKQLSPNGDDVPVASNLADSAELCPSSAVGSEVTSEVCPIRQSLPALRFICKPLGQNSNSCGNSQPAHVGIVQMRAQHAGSGTMTRALLLV